MSAAPLWTGGFAERCALCDTPLLTDEETRGICDNCASACTYPEENCPECDDAGCVRAPRRFSAPPDHESARRCAAAAFRKP